MQKTPNISRNLIAIGALSTLLVFWLSSSFWVEALIQRNGAVQLQRSTQPEAVLFTLTRNIAQERALVHALLSGAENNDPTQVNKLRSVSQENLHALDTAVRQIREARNETLWFVENRYSDQSLQAEIDNIYADLKTVSDTRSQVFEKTPVSVNSTANSHADMQMNMFDAYSRVVQDVDRLRLRTRFVPSKTYPNIDGVQKLKNELCELNESIEKVNTLIDGYLISSNTGKTTDRNNLQFRIFQQQEKIEHSLSELIEISDRDQSANTLVTNIALLNNFYSNTYRPLQTKLLSTTTIDNISATTLSEWRNTSDILRNNIKALGNQTIEKTLSSAKVVENIATRNLIIDTFLVILCLGMALASLSVSRRVQHQANHDDLTKLPNRRKFSENLRDAIAMVKIPKQQLIMLTIDLNGFKAINDTMGHAIGDKLLLQVAERLQEITEERMSIARMGGDEFAILCPSDNTDEANQLADQIQSSLAKKFEIDDGSMNIGASIGISHYPTDASTAEELLVTSDFAMFHAKQEGRNGIQRYNRGMAERFEYRLLIEKDLLRAIKEDQLELHYQPQFNLSMNCVDAVEALIRWNHPTKGLITPDKFIGIAEECGLIPNIGAWVLEEACRQAASWNQELDQPLRVAINVSVHQIMQPDFVDLVFDTIDRNKLAPQHLELEVTESVVMADVEWVIQCLTTLRNAGIKIALDDFGTGYSSLSQLQDLPLNTLKIDRSFIAKLEDQSISSRSVTATIAKIADVYGLETVAEGVESVGQLNQISDLGIHVVQGYYYSKPISNSEVLASVNMINLQAQQQQRAA